MIGGRGGDKSGVIPWPTSHPDKVDKLIEILVEASARYLAMQAAAGPRVLKVFESWAEGLPEDLFDRLVTQPHRRLVARLRALGVVTSR